MPNFNVDGSAEIERLFLWDECTSAFRANAFRLGIQTNYDLESTATTRLVLAEVPDNEDDTLQLWAKVSSKAMVESVSLIFNDPESREVFNYEITPETIRQYSPEPTPLDKEDLMGLRLDVAEAVWDVQCSEDCARELIFFS